jgi:AcrR family transcriptional regulator
MAVTSTTPARGRPRDATLDAAVLQTTREVLAERGFEGTTVQEVSRRSKVHPPAIYRRWPSRLALIEDAAFTGLTEITVEPTGDLRHDLREFLAAYVGIFTSPIARTAIPGLVASYQHDAPPPARWLHLSVRPQLYAILEAAGDDVDPTLDPDDVFDIVLGTVLARTFVPPIAARRPELDTAVDLIVRLLRPS